MKTHLLLPIILSVGFATECLTSRTSELINVKHLRTLHPLGTIWEDIKKHCENHSFHHDEASLERRFIDWNQGRDGEADASARCEVDSSKWNDIDAPKILRPYLMKVLDETREFRLKNGNPASFLWMLRRQTVGEESALKFHRDDNISSEQPVTAILYDTEGVLRGGELIFASENGDGPKVKTPRLYPDRDWLGDAPSIEEIAGSLRHLLTHSPKTGDLVTFANLNLFHAVDEFELHPQGSRIILTLFFYEAEYGEPGIK